MSRELLLGQQPLDVAAVRAVADGGAARLSELARARMAENHARYEASDPPDILQRKEAWLVGAPLDAAPAERVQAFVLSHCAGVGEPLPTAQVRAMILCRAAVLARGLSGCRPELAELLLAMLHAGVHPVVPSKGSVGAAGDLAPLAHLARVAFRLGGQAERGGRVMPASEAMAGLPELLPTPKEVLSLINGATLTVALGALALSRATRLLHTAELGLAMTMEVVLANTGCLDERALAARGHPTAVRTAARIREHLEGSQLVGRDRSADAFSIRCSPAVLGAAWEALDHSRAVVERELGGACDNPLVLDGGELIEAGNFHGAPVALALDHLKIALTQAASIAERRIFRLTYGQLTGNLPSFLLQGDGVNNGFMLAQYTAASLVSECKGLAHPASVDSIPTGQHHEDHVPMGPAAARGLQAILDNLSQVLAIEILVAGQGLEFRAEGLCFGADGTPHQGPPCALAPRVGRALARVRERVPRWESDRVLHRDLAAVAELVAEGALLED